MIGEVENTIKFPKELRLLEEIEAIRRDYKDVIEIYEKYKRLKGELGKKEWYPLDPQKIREDLSSEHFFKILRTLRREEGKLETRRKRNRKNT